MLVVPPQTTRQSARPRARAAASNGAEQQLGRSILGWTVALLTCLAVVLALAVADQKREAASSLADFAQEQHRLADSIAIDLHNRLQVLRRDALLANEQSREGRPPPASILGAYTRIGAASQLLSEPSPSTTAISLKLEVAPGESVNVLATPGELLHGMEKLEVPGESVVLIRPPGDERFFAISGQAISIPALRAAADQHEPFVELSGQNAQALGLPERTAYVGLASFDAGALGSWTVGMAASAERVRDRQARTRLRLAVSTIFAAGLVGTFGTLLLRRLRREHALARDLESVAMSRERGERLERAMKVAALGTLATGIAHELSTPLGVIVARTERLLGMPLEPRVAKNVQAIVDQTGKINDIVRGFLDVARGRSPAVTRHEPSALVAEALELVEHRFVREEVTLSGHVDEGIRQLSGDRRLLVHALVNLLLNACDACEPGGRVSLGAREEGELIVFEVIDDGVGIDPEDAARVTEPLVTTKPAGKGTGLGLAITKEIVSMHRGKLTLEPGQHGGTVARIAVPAVEEVA